MGNKSLKYLLYFLSEEGKFASNQKVGKTISEMSGGS